MYARFTYLAPSSDTPHVSVALAAGDVSRPGDPRLLLESHRAPSPRVIDLTMLVAAQELLRDAAAGHQLDGNLAIWLVIRMFSAV